MFRNSIPIIPRIIHLSETLLDYSVIESRYEKKKKREENFMNFSRLSKIPSYSREGKESLKWNIKKRKRKGKKRSRNNISPVETIRVTRFERKRGREGEAYNKFLPVWLAFPKASFLPREWSTLINFATLLFSPRSYSFRCGFLRRALPTTPLLLKGNM